MASETRLVIALLVIAQRRIGLALAPQREWTTLHGVRMARLEFPHISHGADNAHELTPNEAQNEALALALARYGVGAAPLATRWSYGPSAHHLIDRQPAPPAATAPFLRTERITTQDDATGEPPRLLTTEVYRAELAPGPPPPPGTTAALLWLPPGVLRALALGMRAEDALRLEGVTARLAEGTSLPDDAFIYMPCDYGERLLQRVAAKYGEDALFARPT